jgi:hypothetical protein
MTDVVEQLKRLQAEGERRLDTNGRMRVELANAQAEIKRLQAVVKGSDELEKILTAEIERLRAQIRFYRKDIKALTAASCSPRQEREP